MSNDFENDWMDATLNTVQQANGLPVFQKPEQIYAALRLRRKVLLRSFQSLRNLVVTRDNKVNNDFVIQLSEYLAVRSMAFSQRHPELHIGLYRKFYFYCIHMLASDNVGDESIDDLIQLSECFVRDLNVFFIVAEEILPSSHMTTFREWFSTLDSSPNPAFEDAVLSAVCVFLGVMTDPLSLPQ